MSALKIETTLSEIAQTMSRLAPHRKSALFERFLIEGYSAMTLDSISEQRRADVLRAKLCLGTLITLYDDYADRPVQADSALLDILYRRRFCRGPLVATPSRPHREVIDFANFLFLEIEGVLKGLPHSDRLLDLLNFDLSQFYSANQYSSLVTANPELHCQLENRLYTHHNMGLMMVATMDLMASEAVFFSELGAMREAFLLGQRMGRIFNVLVTHEREALDGDRTGELSTSRSQEELEMGKLRLRREIHSLRRRIISLEPRITTFSVRRYVQGLMSVQKLHEQMEGVI